MGEVDTVYQELLSFLSSPRADLRKAAAEATLATLSSENDASVNEAARRLTSLNAIQPLCKIASAASTEAGSCDALASLSILCAHDLVGNQCILDFIEGSKGVGRMLEIALSSPPTPPSTAASIAALALNSDEDGESSNNNKLASEWNDWRKQVNYACALLANATRTEKGAADFIGLSFPEEAVPSSSMKENSLEDEKSDREMYNKKDTSKPTATLLLSRFLNPAYIDTSSPAYKSAKDAWNSAKQSGSGQQSSNIDEYDSDLDDETLEKDEPALEPDELVKDQKVEPTMNENEHYDPYQHMAAVFINITQLETGRNFLMRLIHHPSSSKNKSNSTQLHSIQENKEEGKAKESTTPTSHLQSILPQLNSPNVLRRQGIAGTLKNCCFAKDSTWWLLNVVHLDKCLLMPLAGPEELTIDEKVGLDPDYWLLGPQKVREPDALVRLYITEALLLLLASGRRARETLRETRMYIIIKVADMVEENEEVSERLLECVQYLRRDEEGTDEGSSDRRAYEKYARGMMMENGAKNSKLKALPPSSSPTTATAAAPTDEEDYDNID
mmetsp:Transcript_22102/g.46634  ORF Transcript_22102/g.46634 Transcript_22102/m.46634 type:complete len:558 (-) Transcript_22102:60-1733(-)